MLARCVAGGRAAISAVDVLPTRWARATMSSAATGYAFPLTYEAFQPNDHVFLRIEGVSYNTRGIELLDAMEAIGVRLTLQDLAVAVQPRDWRVSKYLIKVPPSQARAAKSLQRQHPFLLKLQVEQSSYQEFMRCRSQYPGVVGAPALTVRGLPPAASADDVLRALDGGVRLAPVPEPVTVHAPLERSGGGVSIALIRCWDEEEAKCLLTTKQGCMVGAGPGSFEACSVALELAP